VEELGTGTASPFEMQGANSAVHILLLKISICLFYQLCSSTSASQEISSVWFFRKTCGCSVFQGKKKKKRAGKRKGDRDRGSLC